MNKKVEAGSETPKTVQYPIDTDKTKQEAEETPVKKINKTPDEPYKNILAFSEIDKFCFIITIPINSPFPSD